MGTARNINESYEKIMRQALAEKQKENDAYFRKIEEEKGIDLKKEYMRSYKNVHDQIKKLSRVFVRHKTAFDKNPEWGYIGDLNEAEEKLQDLLGFLGG